MSEENGSEIVVKAETNLTVTIRDDDTGSEVQTKLGIFTREPKDLRNKVFKTTDAMLKELGVIEMSKDLDHDQDKTDNLQKSENPDKGYMDQKNLCQKCHGPKGSCKCTGG
jgi:hypothetical protein